MEIKHRSQLPDLLSHFNLPMIACECGVAEGNFSEDLLRCGIEKLYCVDFWGKIANQSGDGGFETSWHQNNFNQALHKLIPYGERAIILRGKSVEMATHIPNNSLGLVYIDCDHSFQGVSRDILAYWDKLVDGGIMAFHDFEAEQYGVKEAVEHFVSGTGIEIHLITENKKEDAGAYIQKPIAH
jgi:hypothetical protein